MGRVKPQASSRRGENAAKKTVDIYAFDVALIAGPKAKPPKRKGRVSRTIEIRSDQTLDDLHEAIFSAFDRDDEHLYEFQFGDWKDGGDPRYVHPDCGTDPWDDVPAAFADKTTIDSLRLTIGQTFRYWFDFGDDWWHQVELLGVETGPAKRDYPKVTARVGDSPPQYDYDDEEFDEPFEEE